jgi:hypothetical protein
MLRRIALVSLLLLTACGAEHHIYPGPHLGENRLAKLECYRLGTDVRLLAVDGLETPDNYVYLLPGRHRLELEGPTHIAAKGEEDSELASDRDDRRPRVVIELELAIGQHYFLGATHKELAFLKLRSDQTRVWEEGFYLTWTLDVYRHAQGDHGQPELIEQFTYEGDLLSVR